MSKRRKRKPPPPEGASAPARKKRVKLPIGRKKLPPRIDLGLPIGEQDELDPMEAMSILARKVFAAGDVKIGPQPTEYRCVSCGRQVWYPEIYYNDKRCEQCHEKAVKENKP